MNLNVNEHANAISQLRADGPLRVMHAKGFWHEDDSGLGGVLQAKVTRVMKLLDETTGKTRFSYFVKNDNMAKRMSAPPPAPPHTQGFSPRHARARGRHIPPPRLTRYKRRLAAVSPLGSLAVPFPAKLRSRALSR